MLSLEYDHEVERAANTQWHTIRECMDPTVSGRYGLYHNRRWFIHVDPGSLVRCYNGK
jgi:hypothetical protein